MKKANIKLVSSLAACGLIAAVGVGATAAYLTDGETTTNTFTVGKVTVDLSEPNYTPEDDVPRVPNEEIPKDPTVANTGNNDEIVFVSFDIPMDEVVLAGYDGTKQDSASLQELFDFRSASGNYNSVNDGWIALDTNLSGQEVTYDGKTYKRYIYGYQNVVKAAVEAQAAVGNPGEDGYKAAIEAVTATEVPSVFDYVRLANIVEGQIDGDKLDIPVKAYAIQSGYLQNSDNSEINDKITVGDGMSKATLEQIFAIFATQNGTIDETTGELAAWTGINSGDAKTAGAGNVQDLLGNEITVESITAPESSQENNENN